MYRASFPLSQPATYKEDSLSNYSLRSSDLEAVKKKDSLSTNHKEDSSKTILEKTLNKNYSLIGLE